MRLPSLSSIKPETKSAPDVVCIGVHYVRAGAILRHNFEAPTALVHKVVLAEKMIQVPRARQKCGSKWLNQWKFGCWYHKRRTEPSRPRFVPKWSLQACAIQRHKTMKIEIYTKRDVCLLRKNDSTCSKSQKQHHPNHSDVRGISCLAPSEGFS